MKKQYTMQNWWGSNVVVEKDSQMINMDTNEIVERLNDMDSEIKRLRKENDELQDVLRAATDLTTVNGGSVETTGRKITSFKVLQRAVDAYYNPLTIEELEQQFKDASDELYNAACEIDSRDLTPARTAFFSAGLALQKAQES